MFQTVISTSIKPTDLTRALAKLLVQVIPDAKYISRGKRNLSSLIEECLEKDVYQIIMIHSKRSRADRILFYDLKNGNYIENNNFLKIIEFNDPKLFRNVTTRFKGPLSTDLQAYKENPDLFDMLEKYFKIDYYEKRKLWLFIDQRRNETYLQFTDSTVGRRFAMLKIRLVMRESIEL